MDEILFHCFCEGTDRVQYTKLSRESGKADGHHQAHGVEHHPYGYMCACQALLQELV